MLTMIYKFCMLTLVMLMPAWSINAQFIRININIQSGLELIDRNTRTSIVEPVQITQSSGLSIAPKGIKWIELRTRENVPLIIDYGFSRSRFTSMTALYFLNNNTSDFGNSFELPFGKTTVSMFESPISSDQIVKTSNYISAWLGVPTEFNGIINITYP